MCFTKQRDCLFEFFTTIDLRKTQVWNCIAKYLVNEWKTSRINDVLHKLKGLIVEKSENNLLVSTDNGELTQLAKPQKPS